MPGWILQSAGDPPFILRLPPGSVKTVGRTARADFILDAALVSRLHCRLTADASDQLVVEDLNSTNGTLVNGKKVQRAVLREGDTLTVGRVEFSREEMPDAFSTGSRAFAPVPRQKWIGAALDADRRGRPVPGMDRRVVGKCETARFGLNAAACSRSPPGRSVRPMDPANSVSPTNSSRAAESSGQSPGRRRRDSARAWAAHPRCSARSGSTVPGS